MDTLPMALLQLLTCTVGNSWPAVLYPNMQVVSGVRGARGAVALYFCLYRFVMHDVLTAVITSLVIDAYMRRSKLSERVGFEATLAKSLLQRAAAASAAAGPPRGDMSPMPQQATVWVRPELLAEMADVEDAVLRSKRALERAQRKDVSTPALPSWSHDNRPHLEALEVVLRRLEVDMQRDTRSKE